MKARRALWSVIRTRNLRLSKSMSAISSILTTVNAPYSRKLDARMLAHCLTHPEAAKAAPGHMSAFFGEVSPDLQKAFASEFHINEAMLISAAKTFSQYSGELYPLAA